jgi:chromosomal replication initiation ATPase DnaA
VLAARPPAPDVDAQAILAAVAGHFGAPIPDIAGRTKGAQLQQARAIAAALLQERGRSLAEIAKVLGGRDRSTVKGLAQRGRGLLEALPSLRERESA